ncbi:anti-sigma factor, RsrA family [delta proteobacterium NaphS2]|nr:anti-sigma factor, RsrA family [delta proteobacterium NaphS2]
MKEDCQKNFEKINEYLDGELAHDECRQIEQHLNDCPECQKCCDALKKTIDICRKSAQDRIPDDMRKRLRAKLRDCFGDRKTPVGQK